MTIRSVSAACGRWTCWSQLVHVCHGYGRLDGGRDGGGGRYAGGIKPGGVGRISGDGSLPLCMVKTLMTPNHTAFQVRSSG